MNTEDSTKSESDERPTERRLSCVLFYPNDVDSKALSILRQSIDEAEYRLIDWMTHFGQSSQGAIDSLFNEVKKSRRVVLLLSETDGSPNPNLFYEFGFAIGFGEGVKRAKIDGPRIISIAKRDSKGKVNLPFNVRSLDHIYFDQTEESLIKLQESVKPRLKKDRNELLLEFREDTTAYLKRVAGDCKSVRSLPRLAVVLFDSLRSRNESAEEIRPFLERLKISLISIAEHIKVMDAVGMNRFDKEQIWIQRYKNLINVLRNVENVESEELDLEELAYTSELIAKIGESLESERERLIKNISPYDAIHNDSELEHLEKHIDHLPTLSINHVKHLAEDWLDKFHTLVQSCIEYQDFKRKWNRGDLLLALKLTFSCIIVLVVYLSVSYIVGHLLLKATAFNIEQSYFLNEKNFRPIQVAVALLVCASGIVFTPFLSIFAIRGFGTLIAIVVCSLIGAYLSRVLGVANPKLLNFVRSFCTFLIGSILFAWALYPIGIKKNWFHSNLTVNVLTIFTSVVFLSLSWETFTILMANDSPPQKTLELTTLLNVIMRGILFALVGGSLTFWRIQAGKRSNRLVNI